MKQSILLLMMCCSGWLTLANGVNNADENAIPPSPMVSAKQPDYVYTDTSKTIMLSQDKPNFILKLPANPTTGYSWFTKNYDDKILTLEKQVFVAPNSGMTGQGGYTYWYFTAKDHAFQAAYVSEIQLIYARPWELTNRKADNRAAVFIVTTSTSMSQSGGSEIPTL